MSHNDQYCVYASSNGSRETERTGRLICALAAQVM